MKYEMGTFGYWWTELEGNQDISGKIYNKSITCPSAQINDLKGSPKEIKGNFYCYNGYLHTLEYAPRIIRGNFGLTGQIYLKTLKGIPDLIDGFFDCRYSKNLKDINDILDVFLCEIKGEFKCDIMTDKEYRDGRELYLKLKDLDKVKKLLKLKTKMR